MGGNEEGIMKEERKGKWKKEEGIMKEEERRNGGKG
jgi:hypothetical protein